MSLLEGAHLPTGSAAAARFYIAETILGLECIHKAGYVVRDLKPENILVDQQGHAIISDFDMATVPDREPARDQHAGTQEYIAPEIIDSVQSQGFTETCCASSITYAADIWVLGVMLFEMLHGYSPFGRRPGETVKDSRDRIRNVETSIPKMMGKIRGTTKTSGSRKKGACPLLLLRSLDLVILDEAGGRSYRSYRPQRL